MDDDEFERQMAMMRAMAPPVEVSAPVITHKELTFIRKLGDGAFGSVWEGRCRGQPCAIKTLSNFNFTLEQEFKSEVEIMCQNANPFSVLCLGAMTDEQPWAMVTQFMENGDLHQCLHEAGEDDKKLLPGRKFQMLIDISMGMSWLCGDTVRTLHRDLKPANILVDENYRCKISDYGLSLFLAKHGNLGEQNRSGSTFWMASEVLSNGTVTEKSDVYSFGLIMWEMGSEVPLEKYYSTYGDRRDEFDADIKAGKRPDIKMLKPPFNQQPFIDLLERAWHVNPDTRPTFAQLIRDLNHVRINVFLPETLCPDSGALWKKHFIDKPKVEFEAWWEQVSTFMDLPKPQRTKLKVAFFKLMYAQKHTRLMSLSKFSRVLKWLGPLKRSDGSTLGSNFFALINSHWFFGVVDGQNANNILASQKPGCFLVRLNTGAQCPIEESPYTVSFVNEESQVNNARIMKVGDKLQLQLSGTAVEADTVVQLIKAFKEIDDCTLDEPCPGSPFDYLWKVQGMPTYLTPTGPLRV